MWPSVARVITARHGDYGISYYYAAVGPNADPPLEAELHKKLRDIADSERDMLQQRMQQTRFFSARADRLTDYLSWLGVLVGIGAIVLGLVAVQAIRQFTFARREAESESDRAGVLESAVRERTHELWEANQALKAEAAEREAAEAQLRQVQKMEAVGQLTGGIAHDFNNLLAAVLGGLGLIERRGDLSGENKRILTMTKRAADQGSELVRRLLAFSRQQQLEPAPLDLESLHEGVDDLLSHTLGGLVELDWQIAPDAWSLFADRSQLELALMNLIINARDAMRDGGTITVLVENRSVAADDSLPLP